MFNELELLKLQVEEELKKFGEEHRIVIYVDWYNGSYIEHFPENKNDKRLPVFKDPKVYATVSHHETLGTLYKAIVDELESRIQKRAD